MNLECCKMLDNFFIEDNHVMVYVCIKTGVQSLPCAMVWRLVWRIYITRHIMLPL